MANVQTAKKVAKPFPKPFRLLPSLRYWPIRICQALMVVGGVFGIVAGVLTLNLVAIVGCVLMIFLACLADVLVDIELNTRKLR